MKKLSMISLLFLFASGTVAFTGHSAEIKTRFGKITYDSPDALREFNHELYMGRLKSRVNESDTLEGEVKHKLEYIVQKVMLVQDMNISKLNFRIVIHPSEEGVQEDFNRLYGVEVNYIAFYSPDQNIVFYSAEDASLRVVAHEIGHVVAEHYFQVSPPSKIHEVMAQYAEKHVTD
ncbi:MAG: hypothetical protein K9J83_02000 [Desulfarculaceae bacterium]|nr:hypothetical protein [Desulfarculaceae bacterium]